MGDDPAASGPPGSADERPAPASGGRSGCRFSLRELLVVFAAVSLLCALVIPAWEAARIRANRTTCKNNLRQLGVYLNVYVSRWGNDEDYPSCSPPAGGLGGGMPAGANGAFWSHLWRLPAGATLVGGANARAVSKRPGEDGLYACKVYRLEHGLPVGPATLHYAGPDLTVKTIFPGALLTDRVSPYVYIGGDLLLPGDCNHGGDAAGPTEEFNGLRFDGSVQAIPPGSAEQRTYLDQTDAESGARTP